MPSAGNLPLPQITLPAPPPLSLLLALSALLLLPLLLCRARLSSLLASRVLRALRLGGAPESVAFIMDGNRRWARLRGAAPQSGHPRGGDTLASALRWCLHAGVRRVTVYAFSLENFKRPREEVDEIFALATRKLEEMLAETDVVREHRVRVNVLGDLALVPEGLRRAACRAMWETRGFVDGPVLDICFAYTARREMAGSVAEAVRMVREGGIRVEDIDEHLLAAGLYTGLVSGCGVGDVRVDAGGERKVEGQVPGGRVAEEAVLFNPKRFGYPDLLVRTSGEIRLSDFLLMQAAGCIISFQSVLWPDLTAWHMIAIILDYQAQRRLQRAHKLSSSFALPSPSRTFHSKRVQSAVEAVRHNFYARIHSDAIQIPPATS